MATASAAASSSSSSSRSFSSKATASPPPPPPHSPLFASIQEIEREDNEDRDQKQRRFRETPTTWKDSSLPSKPHPTPTHPSTNNGTCSIRKRPESENSPEHDPSVSCNKCRPGARERISVVPLDANGVNKHSSSSIASPNGIFKSILSSLTRRSPRSTESSSKGEEQWKLAVSELSHKLIQATRKRDEALLEASRLKYSMVELERKLNKLEIYCHDLKSGLEVCSSNSPYRLPKDLDTMTTNPKGLTHHDKVVEHFLVSVSEARSCVRILSRSLTLQLRQIGGKVYEKIALLLHPYDVKISSRNPRSLLFYLEALLNRALYEDFESVGFQKSGSNRILNPIERCEASLASFTLLQGLTWEEVLNKGTKHFSDEFSRFCDLKMSEIVAMLGWNRAWPEPLLQAFFGASKSVWLVHLLAWSVHPSLQIFRVDKGVAFDGVYMEDMGGDKARKLVPTVVRIMVAPGFYISSNVIKCKALCRYNNDHGGSNSNSSPLRV